MSKNTKQIIISLVIIIIAFVGYKIYFVDDTAKNVSLVADKSSNSQFIDGQMILVLLNQLNRVTLDDSIFSNKVFTRLISFERPIADQPIGRENPFLPIGSDARLPNTTATTTVR